MPPKAKKRKVKESEEELFIQEKLTEAFFKYRHDDMEIDGEVESVGMFGAESDEGPKIHVKDMEKVARDIGVEWDESVLAVVDPEKRQKGIIDIETMKLVVATLLVRNLNL